MIDFVLSAATIAVFALIYGAVRIARSEGFSRKPVLMIAAAMVIAGNVAVWVVPDSQGNSLFKEADKPR